MNCKCSKTNSMTTANVVTAYIIQNKSVLDYKCSKNCKWADKKGKYKHTWYHINHSCSKIIFLTSANLVICVTKLIMVKKSRNC